MTNGLAKLASVAAISGTLFFFIGKAETAGTYMEKVATLETQSTETKRATDELGKRITAIEIVNSALSTQVVYLTKAVTDLTTELKRTRR